MFNHVWGLLAHPGREFQQISQEKETVSHLYTRNLLVLAAVPVVCSFIGTTQFGWMVGDEPPVKVSLFTAAYIAIIFYGMLLAAVAVVGRIIHLMARRYAQSPSLERCIIFAGYTATPMFLSGLVAVYPLVWLCLLAGIIGLCYCAYLLYSGIPTFLNIDRSEGFIFSSSTLALGILVLEALLAITVLMWGYGSHFW
ncbi:YIP1 family protein [Budviciaceae bacterium CWB-B4]|uniref:YIP1 family protein n=1 Tax=Limnobaculum xujianqingii TaxID=2738837 RepID=A0A9D7AGY5_9GAMM|nr:Yip1 family protein [Limnobaculum xujianqingii]MBK5072529.1 YIP1 family protein [Limnobaculum xujianqingii]MBK5175838.1 YIP1 family protein [Limnobaculum xujianqingii]